MLYITYNTHITYIISIYDYLYYTITSDYLKKGFPMKKMMYTVLDVARLLNVSQSMAYKLLREMNDELSKKGYLTVRGKIPAKYFHERYYMVDSEDKA